MSGRPARVGLMIPSSNTMMEVDFTRDLPPGTALHTARMYMEDTTPAGENRMLDEFALPAARDLGTARPDVVVFGCTSAGALRGNDYDTKLCQRISELTGAPVVSTIGAVRTAIEASGAASIGVITPYIDELNEKTTTSRSRRSSRTRSWPSRSGPSGRWPRPAPSTWSSPPARTSVRWPSARPSPSGWACPW
jgi:maleate isomerase